MAPCGRAVAERMRLIVGLGNPGLEYAWTPHNLGFLAVDRLAEAAGIRVERPEAKSFVGRGKLGGHEIVLAKPQTSMNLSGLAVRELLGRLECEPSEMLVIYDDVALPWGMIRIRENGTAGGHNGLKSVVSAAQTLEFPRLRLGVKPEKPPRDLAAYVLRPMRKSDLEVAAEMIEQAAEAVGVILTEGIGVAMNRYNRRAELPEEGAE